MADVQFTVDDTSPTISYSPFADTFSTPNLTAGWNPYYTLSGFAHAPADVGKGNSLHITSYNGASLVLQWHGTGIQLYGNATAASYSITLDGAPFTPATPNGSVLATIDGLTDAPHSVTLTAEIPPIQNPPNSSMIVFDKAILTSSPAPANVSFQSQTINDNDIALFGHWSFDARPSGNSFHTSQTRGDRAVTSFSGTTFLLQGMTSPSSGNYTVSVDNVTTSLSALSTFTVYDSLLFFVTGLNSTAVHSVEITNNGGGDLSLLVGGLNTFVPTMTLPQPVQNSPTAVVTSDLDISFAPGTIAAFVLAGILSCIILSGLLFFFLFYRPRRRRRRVLAEPKEHETGVLNIGPDFGKTAEYDLPTSQPDNTKNGFSRWRRGAMEGSPGETSLPIHFRHSDSFDEKYPSPLNEVQLDDLSENPSRDSSTKRKARAKSKGKARQITGRSWSPGITLDFPMQRWRRSHRQSATQNAPSAIESLGYVSTFAAAEPSSPKLVAPPSYAASVSNRDSNPNSNSNPSSNMPSVPRSVSPFPGDHDRSYPQQNQETAGTFLLHSRGSNSERSSNSAGNSPHRLKPEAAIPMRSLAADDRGSAVEDNLDDNQSVLGPASLQQVIRSLSPRTVRHPYANRDSIQEPPSPQETDLEDDVGLISLPQTLTNDDQTEFQEGAFLSVRTPSPFRLSFDISRIKPPTTDNSNSAGLSYVTASSSAKPSARSSAMSNVGLESTNPDAMRPPLPSVGPEFVQGPSYTRFRLTPLSIPPSPIIAPANSSNENSEGVTSFLDLTSSREGSLASRSIKARWSEERRGSSLYPPMEEKSRWSNTTMPSMKSKSSSSNSASAHGSSNGSQKVPSEPPKPLPRPLPIPGQPNIQPSTYMNPDRLSRATSGLTQNVEHLHVHPAFEALESPTESIPMSVSELRFRQSVSEENPGFDFNSRRTTDSSLVFVSPQPPLPSPYDDFMPRPFDPSILVNRVLGLPTPSPTTTARPIGHTNTPSVSVATPSPIPFASRHDTNNRGDRSNSENSGTD